jgi:hypothetical protein
MPSERERVRAFLDAHPEWAEFLSEKAKAGKLMAAEDIAPSDELIVVVSNNPAEITGSKQVKCGCGAIVWMSPSTQELIRSRKGFPTRVVCVRCAVRGGLET